MESIAILKKTGTKWVDPFQPSVAFHIETSHLKFSGDVEMVRWTEID